MNPINNLRDFEPKNIPTFTSDEYDLLKKFNNQIPEGTDTLAARVIEFKTVADNLDKETKWNKAMPWVVAAIEISLIAAIALGFIFGGPLGIIPTVLLWIYDTSIGIAAGCKNFALPPIGAIVYIGHLVMRQSDLENRHRVLSQELPEALRETAAFWEEHGPELLQKVQEAADQAIVAPLAEPSLDETLEQMKARLENQIALIQDAQNRKKILEELAGQIQIGQQLTHKIHV